MGNTHTEEHPNDISDHLIVQDWQKRYLANHQLVQGWKWGLLWFVVVGVRQSLVGLICTRRTIFPFPFSISYLDGEPLKTFLRLVDIRVRVQL